nr:hypothetical protein [Tanacetum cinerariifolium]
MVISKLKEGNQSLSGNTNTNKVKKDIEETKTINIKLDHRVSKLIAENEHLKQTYKQLYDLIKPTCVRSKENYDALINQVNQKSVEISDLNVSLQEKDLVITALKDDLRKLNGKALVDDLATSHSTAPEMLKVDVEPLSPKLLNNRTAHSDYLRHTGERRMGILQAKKGDKNRVLGLGGLGGKVVEVVGVCESGGERQGSGEEVVFWLAGNKGSGDEQYPFKTVGEMTG